MHYFLVIVFAAFGTLILLSGFRSKEFYFKALGAGVKGPAMPTWLVTFRRKMSLSERLKPSIKWEEANETEDSGASLRKGKPGPCAWPNHEPPPLLYRC